MNAIRIITLWGLLLTLILLPSGCGNQQMAAVLDGVEACMQSRPDSALAVLRTMDTSSLDSRRLQARYALLHAMALDKNWIDTTDIGVVMPAVDYFSRKNKTEQSMKALYYLGRIYENQGDYEAAIVSFLKAQEKAGLSEDEDFKGLLAFGFESILQKTHNVNKALEYAKEGLTHYRNAQDTLRCAIALGHLAKLYQEKQDWVQADSLYNKSITYLAQDTEYVTKYLSLYAAMKVVQPEADPQGAINLLKRRITEYKKPLSLKDYSVYAYAEALCGEDQICDDILKMISKQPEGRRKQTRYMEYRIAEYRGDSQLALSLLKATYLDQDSILMEVLSQSAAQSIAKYHENRSYEVQRQLKERRRSWTLLFFALILLFGTTAYFMVQRKEKEKRTAEELIRVAEETNKMLQKANQALETDIDQLQKTFVCFYRNQLEKIGKLCEAYVKGKDRKDDGKEKAVYRRVERIVEEMNRDEESYLQFEAQVNRYFGGIVQQLKGELSREKKLSPSDTRFICYSIAGFDSNTISMLLGISLANVYTKRTRLKERIRQLDSSARESYLSYFS